MIWIKALLVLDRLPDNLPHLELGLLRIALNFRDNGKAQLSDLFSEYPKLIKYLLASALFGLMLIIPFWFIIFAMPIMEAREYGAAGTVISIILSLIVLVAIVYLFLKYQFYGYIIVDRGSGPLEALKESGRLTEGILKNLFIFWLEIGLGIAIALATVSIFIELPLYAILGIISEDLAPLAGDIVSSAIQLFIMVPITRLAMADIYRRLESRLGGWAPPAASG